MIILYAFKNPEILWNIRLNETKCPINFHSNYGVGGAFLYYKQDSGTIKNNAFVSILFFFFPLAFSFAPLTWKKCILHHGIARKVIKHT